MSSRNRQRCNCIPPHLPPAPLTLYPVIFASGATAMADGHHGAIEPITTSGYKWLLGPDDPGKARSKERRKRERGEEKERRSVDELSMLEKRRGKSPATTTKVRSSTLPLCFCTGPDGQKPPDGELRQGQRIGTSGRRDGLPWGIPTNT